MGYKRDIKPHYHACGRKYPMPDDGPSPVDMLFHHYTFGLIYLVNAQVKVIVNHISTGCNTNG